MCFQGHGPCSAAVSIAMHVCFRIIVLFRYMPGNGITGSYGNFVFEEPHIVAALMSSRNYSVFKVALLNSHRPELGSFINFACALPFIYSPSNLFI